MVSQQLPSIDTDRRLGFEIDNLNAQNLLELTRDMRKLREAKFQYIEAVVAVQQDDSQKEVSYFQTTENSNIDLEHSKHTAHASESNLQPP